MNRPLWHELRREESSRMRPITFISVLFCLLSQLLLAQVASLTSRNSAYLDQARIFIDDGRYATAHHLLDSLVRANPLDAAPVCLMIENVLLHHDGHRDHRVFYLQDRWEQIAGNTPRKVEKIFWYPQRVLRKLLQTVPDHARALKLLGDFYRLKFEVALRSTDSQLVAREMQKKVFVNYQRAVKFGERQPAVNRWLGNYYLQMGDSRNAHIYFEKNLNPRMLDAESLCRLAELYYIDKKYSQAYNAALLAIQNSDQLEKSLYYTASRCAALSLFNLGEIPQFLEHAAACKEIYPDVQDAYLDILAYYDSRDDISRMQEEMREMLIHNPFDRDGFRFLENYSVRQADHLFAEGLLEEIGMRFENADEVMGNIYLFRGNLAYHRGENDAAQRLWDISRNYFQRCLPENDEVFRQIGSVELKSMLRRQ